EQRFRKPQVTGSNPVVGSTHQMSNTESSVSIIVPTLNEVENIAPLVSQIIASAAPFREILFIDNNSTDASRDMIRVLAASHPIRLIEQDHAELGLSAIGRSRLLEHASPAGGFKIAFETIVRSGRTLQVFEIPIVFHNRVRGKSKMSFGIALRFFFRWLLAMSRHLVWGPYRPTEIARSTISSNASID